MRTTVPIRISNGTASVNGTRHVVVFPGKMCVSKSSIISNPSYYSTSRIAFEYDTPSPPSISSSYTNTYYYDDDNDDENCASSSSPSSSSEEEEEIVKAQLYGLTGSNVAHTRLQNDLEKRLTRLAQLQKNESSDDDEDDTTKNDNKEDANDGTDMILVNAMRDVSEVQLKLGMLEDALTLQQQILTHVISIHTPKSTSTSTSTSTPPADHKETARTMHAIGSIQTLLHRYAESQKWLESALEMKRRLYCTGPHTSVTTEEANRAVIGGGGSYYHMEIGKTLNALALLHIRFMSSPSQDRFDDDSIGVTLNLMDEADSQYRFHATTGPELLIGQDEDEDEDEVESWDGHAHAAGTAVDDESSNTSTMVDHPDLASICENMAMLYRQQRNLPRALDKYEEALRIREKLAADVTGAAAAGSNEMRKIVSLYMDIADCMGGTQGGLKRYKDALERYQRALHVHATLVRTDRLILSQDSSSTNHNNNNNNNKDDEHHKAVTEGTSTTDIVTTDRTTAESAGQVGTSVEGVLRHNIGTMHAQMNSHDLALEEYQIALSIKKALVGDDHPEVAITLNAIGALMARDSSEAHKSLAYFREALRIYRLRSSSQDAHGDGDESVWSVGDGDEADELAAKILKNIELVENNLLMGNMMHGRSDTATGW